MIIDTSILKTLKGRDLSLAFIPFLSFFLPLLLRTVHTNKGGTTTIMSASAKIASSSTHRNEPHIRGLSAMTYEIKGLPCRTAIYPRSTTLIWSVRPKRNGEQREDREGNRCERLSSMNGSAGGFLGGFWWFQWAERQVTVVRLADKEGEREQRSSVLIGAYARNLFPQSMTAFS